MYLVGQMIAQGIVGPTVIIIGDPVTAAIGPKTDHPSVERPVSCAEPLGTRLITAHSMSIPVVSTATKGSRVQRPSPSARLPASQGNSAAPILPALAIKPMALGSKRGGTQPAISAIMVGKMGPKLKPARKRPAAAGMGPGTNQTI